MSTPQFPESLPGVSTLQWQPVSQLASSERDSDMGPLSYRRQSQVPAANAEVTWVFLSDDFAVFQQFYNEDLLRGHKWFSLRLPCAAGYAIHVVRFRSHRSAKLVGLNAFEVTAQLYVRERQLREDVSYTYFTSTPYPVYAVEELDHALEPLSGSLTALMGFETEELDAVLSVIDGELRAALIFGYETEEIDAVLTLLSGELRSALISYDSGNEPVDATLTVLSGVLKNALIQNSIPFEGVDTSLTIISGTLA